MDDYLPGSGPGCPVDGDPEPAGVEVLTLKDKRPLAQKEAAWDDFRARVAAWQRAGRRSRMRHLIEAPRYFPLIDVKPAYVLVFVSGEPLRLIGPFATRALACAWGEDWQKAHGDDPRWQLHEPPDEGAILVEERPPEGYAP